MEREIKEFIEAVGAIEPNPSDENYSLFKSVFKRSNYFKLNKKFLIVKISRSEKPFFGVGKPYIELLNLLDNYFLVLLVNSREGWVYSKSEINAYIEKSIWRLNDKDNNYKINSYTLKGENLFASPDEFLRKLGMPHQVRHTSLLQKS